MVSERLGQTVAIENRTDMPTVVGTQLVARAEPDGHTILAADNAFYFNPAIQKQLPYDTLKDFAGVTMLAESPVILMAGPRATTKTLRDLITAAKRFFRKLLKGLQYMPRVIVTDKLRSYAAAKREILPGLGHRQSRYLNNRAEVSHQPTRRRERQMQRFKSARHAQRFLSTHSRIHNHFQLRRHLLTATEYRTVRGAAFSAWRDVTGFAAAV
ncbi:tripartite tricarboxylate transporter substrate-binding protein [Roseomonas sp. SXEYE001]|uniref:tripartite tricarboxylate transporter substrate-binding protein n=1 Tax=Roseomonas xinghualingensis TaxID=2986475 RepID=UPI0038D3BE03